MQKANVIQARPSVQFVISETTERILMETDISEIYIILVSWQI